MAWTTPGTAVTGAVLTASFWNTHVRNNMRETAPAKVTTDGDILVATGANALERVPALDSSNRLKLLYGGLGIDLSGVTEGQILQGASGGGAFELAAAAKGIKVIGSGNIDITNGNQWATQANTPDIDLPTPGTNELWGVAFAAPSGDARLIESDIFFGSWLTGRTDGSYGMTAAGAQRLDFQFRRITTDITLSLGKTSGDKLLVRMSSVLDPMPLVLFRFPV